MKLYRLMSRIFPASFAAKVLLLACLGIQIPLLAFVDLGLDRELHETLASIVVMVMATAIGTLLTLMALRNILSPLLVIARHLESWDAGRHPGHLPDDFADEVGRVMHHTNRLLDRVTDHVDQSRLEADTDPMTGLLNRRGAERRLMRSPAGWLVHFDIDQFKRINDAFGHDMGDQIICRVAGVAGTLLRASDVLARFGGEEFILVLPEVDQAEALRIANRLRESIESAVATPLGPVTISAGLARHAGGSRLGSALLASDAALYEAKRSGRNRVHVSPDSSWALVGEMRPEPEQPGRG
ncbi:GGDEF domain-containing protein [Rubellimicrobium arenae]|uniref:GGDEF domain-containing protein n=1 Tax=Rubellimicrobium arenae TaxID=2817372 RepID=UPI001B3064F6|nr:GGDEF domain-containing protein [Rubellimicrobium arenae]